MKIILWGAGGHGKVVYDIAVAAGEIDEITFVDDSSLASSPLPGSRIRPAGPDSFRELHSQGYTHFVSAIGDNFARQRCFDLALDYGFTPTALIHPSAVISPSAMLGMGTVVMPRAVVNAAASIGRNAVVNTGVIVEHDCMVGDHVHLTPGVVLGGGACIESYAYLGIGTIVLPNAHVGTRAIIGAGGVVLKGVPAGVTAAGVPTRVLKIDLSARQANR